MTINGSVNGCSAQKTSLMTKNKIDLPRNLGFGDFKSLMQLKQSLVFFSSIKKTRGDSSRRVSNCKLQLPSTLKTAYVLSSKPNTGNGEIKHRVYGKREIQVDKFPNEK